MNLSKKRQRELDTPETRARVMRLYNGAIDRWGKEAVDKDLTRLWDLRCIWGMHRILPFGNTAFTSLDELLWVAESLCGLGKRRE